MSDQNDKQPSEPPLTLAPPDTAVGAMERAFLTETRSPGDPKYNPSAESPLDRDGGVISDSDVPGN